MESAEDSLLIAMVTRRKLPVFSFHATAIFRRSKVGQSDFANSPSRNRDLRSFHLRTSTVMSPYWINSSSLELFKEKPDALRAPAVVIEAGDAPA